VRSGTYLGSVYQYELAGAGEIFRIQTTRPVTQDRVFVRIPQAATTVFAAGPEAA